MIGSDDPRHGTVNAYQQHRCRCAPCQLAKRRYEKRRTWLAHQGLNLTVPAVGFQRRVHALMAIGWTQRSIAEALGIAHGNLSLKMRANTYVYRATHVAMCEVYEARCMTPQRGVVNDRTARIAAKAGHAPPLAWDDIDDPNEEPHGTENPRHARAGRPQTHDMRAEDAEWLADADETLGGACRRLGITPDGLWKACKRSGRLDVYDRLARRELDGEMRQNVRTAKRSGVAA
jgi:hypothetical protein